MKKRFVGVRSIGAAVAALSIAVITLPAVSSTLGSVASAVPGLSALSSSPAAAAGALNCTGSIYDVETSGALYSISASSPYTVTNTGVNIGPGGGADVNALAISSDGSEGYTADFSPASNHTTNVYAYDFVHGVQQTHNVPIASGVTEVVAGAVDPLNGYYYYGGWNPSSGSTSLSLYAMSPTGAGAEVGTVQAPSGSPTFLSGDFAFDGSGNLYILAGYSATGGYNAHVLVVPGPLGTSGTSTLAATNLTPSGLNTTSSQVYDGIAFGSSSQLFAGSESGSFVSINANTGTVSTLPNLTGGSSWADMASCQYNGSLTLQKNVVGRVASSDQFNLSISDNGTTLGGGTATTTGTATGVQAAKAGPVVGIPGQYYTIAETVASGSLSNYATTYSCLNGSNPFASGSGTSVTLPMFPQATSNTGAQIVCTFTNTPATLTISKATTTSSVTNVGDTISYSYTVTNTGPVTLTNVSVVDNPISPAGGLTTGPTCTGLTNPTAGCTSTSSTTLASQQTATFSGTYKVTQADLNNGSVNDTSTATGTPPGGGTITGTSNQVTVPANQNTGLTITKTPSPSSVSTLGAPVTYTYVVTNTSNVTLNGVNVVDTQTSPAGPLASGPTCQSLSNPAASSCTSTSSTTLLPQQSATFTATYDTTQADLDHGSIHDSATSSGTTDLDKTVNSNTAQATVMVTQTPGLTTLKATTTSTVSSVGTVIPYTFTVTNSGNVTLTNVSVTDTGTAPAGGVTATCQNLTNPAGSCSGTTVASLAPGQIAHFTGSYTVTLADLNNGSINDSATSTGTNPPSIGGTTTSPPSMATVGVTQSPKLSIVKSTTTISVSKVGDAVNYTYVVTNMGNVTLTNVSVADQPISPAGALTSGPTCQSLATPSGTCSGSSTTLLPNQSATFTGVYSTTQADLDNGSINDTSKTTGTNPQPLGGTTTATSNEVTVPTEQTDTLSVVKGSPTVNYSAVGDTISYTFAVTNTGNTTLTNVSVADNPVSPATGSTTPQCQNLTNPAGTCSGATVASLAPDQVAHFTATYNVSLADLNNGSVSDTSTGHGTGPGSTPVSAGSNEVTVPAVQNDTLSVVKGSPTVNYSAVGDTISYTFAVTNTGNTTLTNVSVADNPVSPATGSTTPQCQNLTNPAGTCSGATVASLAPDQVAHFTATYSVSQADLNNGSVSDTSTANGTGPGSTPVSAGSNEVTVPAVQTDTLSVVKSANVSSVDAVDQQITYSYAVKNTGNTTLTNVSVTDNPIAPAGATSTPQCQNLTNPSGTCSGATLASLAPGQTATFTATYDVTQTDINNGSINDTSTANGTGPGSTPVTGTSNQVTVTATQTNTLSIVKSTTTASYSAVGDVIDYTYVVTDTGNTTLSNVSVADNPVSPATGSSTPQCQSLANPSDTCSGATVASLAPGQSATFTATYSTSQADLNHGSVSDTSTATGTAPDPTTVTANSNEVTVPAVQSPSISVTKTSDVSTVSTVGQTVTYTFAVQNTGNVTLDNVDVTDAQAAPSLDSSLSAITCVDSSDSPVTNGSFSLDPGATATCSATYTVTQADLSNGSVSDTATVTGTPPNGGTPVTGGSTLTLSVTGVSVTKSVNPTSIVSGSTTPIVYTLTVKNTGSTTTTAPINVTDAAPTGTTLVTSSPACSTTSGGPTCSVSVSSGTITWTIPAGVPAGASYALTFSVTLNASETSGSTVSNTANWSGPSCGTPVQSVAGANSSHATTPTTCPTNVVTTSVTAAPATAPATTPTTAAPVTPTAAPVTKPSTSPAIAFTGAMLSQEWLIGLGLLLLGATLVMVARWRRRSPRHAAK